MRIEDFKLTDLPDAPGVYFFLARPSTEVDGVGKREVLYIGKATSLRDRVRSYFNDDLIATRGPLLVDMVTQAQRVDFLETDSVLEALIIEAREIKAHLPHFNTKEKDNKSFNFVVITKEDFPRILVERGRNIEKEFTKGEVAHAFGPFPQGSVLREGMKIIRKIFPWRDNKCEPFQGKPCFNAQIGLCPGVCTGSIAKEDYRDRVKKIRMFFEGKKKDIIRDLESEMGEYAQRQEFEKAGEAKKTIFALNHIHDVALIKESREDGQSGFRIEGYDIAHMAGSNTVGVMTVLVDSYPEKAQYRKFKIAKAKGGDDVACLKEMLSRRLLHTEWQLPSLLVVDGGTAQLNAVREALTQVHLTLPVVGVVKNEHHRPEKIIGDEIMAKSYEKEILLVNNEAHRFAIQYTRRLRKIPRAPKRPKKKVDNRPLV